MDQFTTFIGFGKSIVRLRSRSARSAARTMRSSSMANPMRACVQLGLVVLAFLIEQFVECLPDHRNDRLPLLTQGLSDALINVVAADASFGRGLSNSDKRAKNLDPPDHRHQIDAQSPIPTRVGPVAVVAAPPTPAQREKGEAGQHKEDCVDRQPGRDKRVPL
jgi:hypothetical protein